MPSGFISTSAGSTGWRRISEVSGEKGWVLRPWKERAQSMGVVVVVESEADSS